MSKAFGVAAVLMGLPAAVNAAPLPNSQKDATVIFRDRPSGASTASCPCGPFPVSAPIFITSASIAVTRPSIQVSPIRRFTPSGPGFGARPAHGTITPRAYSSSEVSARGTSAPGPSPPILGTRSAASGANRASALKDFYPLFPKYAYFTEAQISAPINMVDVFPSVTIQPRRDFAVTAGVDFLWL